VCYNAYEVIDMPDIATYLINFLLGVAFGFLIFSMLYVYFFLRGNIKSKDSDPVDSIDEDTLKAMVTDKQQTFKRMHKKKEKGYAKTIFDLSYELVEDISKYHFPNAKHPMLELTVDEMLNLNYYITKRVEELLEQPILKSTRNVRVSHMVALYERKKSIEQTKVVKFARNKKLRRAFKATMGAINIFNPAYWFRKLIIKTSIDFMSTRIAFMIIGVVGEETSKVYSKKLFDKDMQFDLVDQELRALEEGEDDDADSDS